MFVLSLKRVLNSKLILLPLLKKKKKKKVYHSWCPPRDLPITPAFKQLHNEAPIGEEVLVKNAEEKDSKTQIHGRWKRLKR